MAEEVHRFYCPLCSHPLFGSTAAVLAMNVNSHNDKIHPFGFCGWVAGSIVVSDHYQGPSEPPEYLQPYTAPASKPVEVSERDKIFLTRNGIRWD